MHAEDLGMTGPGLQRAARRRSTNVSSTSRSVVDAVADLLRALEALEAIDPDTDSLGYDRATDQVIVTARRLTEAAVPILANPSGLHQAVSDAIADRRDLTAWCRDCERSDSETGLCGDHEADLLQADAYERLLPAVKYTSPSPEGATSG